MISCPSCSFPNLYGAVFCGECGALLPPAGALNAGAALADSPAESPASRDKAAATTATMSQWAMLHVLEGGQDLALAGRDEFTLGRRSGRQPVAPDIDFAPFQGYSSGVSRLHAMIRRRGNRVLLKDLNSANGTYVNGRRIHAGREEPLANGDIIALGKLKIQIQCKTT